MPFYRALLRATAALACAAPLAAQQARSCSAGPGVAFGVTAYECASCGFRKEKDALAIFDFHAEPVVIQAEPGSALRAGDIIEAVNGQPITTRAGADQFTYPKSGESVIAVRRGRSRVSVTASVSSTCAVDAAPSSEPLIIVDGIPVTNAPEAPPAGQSENVGRFGLAVACTASCTGTRASDGAQYWKFGGYPPVSGIRPGGAAALAGVRVGDVIVEVDGISILDERGALRFMRSEASRTLRLTLLRNGRRVEYLLQAR